MKFTALLPTAVLTALAVTAAVASPGIARRVPAAAPISGSQQDNAFGADMGVVHELLADHSKIKRTVTNLPNGIRAATESDDPQVAKEIKDHVASMDQRLKHGKVFNVASHTLPAIFANKDKIHTEIQQTPTGVIVTQTSNDPATVAALQGHAGEVSDLAREGMPALMRSAMANGGPMGNGGAGHGQTAQGGQMSMGMMAGKSGPMNGGGSMMAHMMQHMMQGGGPTSNMHGDNPMMNGHVPVRGGPPSQTMP